ncbi:hypothetical protein HH308_06120 [Gordonia sp. TBRC 11910]|uniref:Uncharacterized protein n=1 Tax=Gordonia asplenii TaxID=2725283 RepID=A0A848KRR9_9ACTN|nr:MmpS family transport accessory protein [Gordonia asplenii]NMO00789.1 hypothetical protein [Gordonia asplenii]
MAVVSAVVCVAAALGVAVSPGVGHAYVGDVIRYQVFSSVSDNWVMKYYDGNNRMKVFRHAHLPLRTTDGNYWGDATVVSDTSVQLKSVEFWSYGSFAACRVYVNGVMKAERRVNGRGASVTCWA